MLGYLCLSNPGGIAILEIIHGIDDQVIAQMQGTEKAQRKTRHKIRYNANGDSYFIKHGRRYYLNEFMRG